MKKKNYEITSLKPVSSTSTPRPAFYLQIGAAKQATLVQNGIISLTFVNETPILKLKGQLLRKLNFFFF